MAIGTDDALAEEARRWWVRLDGGRLSARERRSFERWLSTSAAHRAAFDAVEALWGELQQLQGARLSEDGLSGPHAAPPVHVGTVLHQRISPWRAAACLAGALAIGLSAGAAFFFGDPLTAWRPMSAPLRGRRARSRSRTAPACTSAATRPWRSSRRPAAAACCSCVARPGSASAPTPGTPFRSWRAMSPSPRRDGVQRPAPG